MTTPIITGKLITLRPPRESDKADRLAAGRDPEVRYSYGGDYSADPPWAKAEIEEWYANICGKPYNWIIDLNGRNIGGAGLNSFDNVNRNARFAIGLMKSSDLSKGYGTEATKLVLSYGFEELKLHRIDLRVLSFNNRAIRCYEKCGFIREGIERETLYQDGEWKHDLIMSILEDVYRAKVGPSVASRHLPRGERVGS
jgi:ribosomal-protein-alanine N-acetyltransferase